MSHANPSTLIKRVERPGGTRRDFLKQSLLACASGLAIGNAVQPTLAAAESRVAGVPDGTSGPPEPIVPYGSGETVFLADFDRCQPAKGLARTWQPGCWKLLEFEAEGLKGTLLSAGQNTGVPDLEYPLRHTGWFAIYFGLMSKYGESRLEVRRKRDDTFVLLTHHNMVEARLDRRDIEFGNHLFTTRHFDELFWKVAHLDGREDAIVLRQVKVQTVPGDPNSPGNRYLPCWLGYIKLVELTDAEVAALRADRERRDTRRLFAHNDSYGSTSWLRFRSEGDIRREIEPFRDTDFSRMYWEAGMGDVTYYPSKVGTLFTLEWMRDKYRIRDRLVGETYTDFRAQGIDPFRVALEHCHACGLEFHAAYRVAGFSFPPPEDEWNAGGLFARRPEWRCRGRNGAEIPRLSYAYPGVRQFVLDLVRELAVNPIDGVCLLYNRRLPLLGYEAPLVESFVRQHGLDPRTLPEEDGRWLDHRAAVLTDFMRELRAVLRQEQQRQGRSKPFGVTAVVVSSEAENFQLGLDLGRWVGEGLIDTLIPYSSIAGIASDAPSWVDPRAAEYFVRLTRGTRCQLALNLMPRQIAPEDYKRRAHALYAAGVENLFLWDCYQRNNFDSSWTTLTRLGHREELADWVRRGQPKVAAGRRTLSRIGDWDLAYGTPG